MAKYCSICLGEFRDSIVTCPIDGVTLVTQKPSQSERFCDIYAAAGEIEAERIMTILRDKGIATRRSVTGISQLPVMSDTAYIIAVLKDDINDAKELIRQARSDSVITDDGNFI